MEKGSELLTILIVDDHPLFRQGVAQTLPLTHLVALARGCSLHLWNSALWLSLLYLLAATLLFLPVAIALMVRRIVR